MNIYFKMELTIKYFKAGLGCQFYISNLWVIKFFVDISTHLTEYTGWLQCRENLYNLNNFLLLQR